MNHQEAKNLVRDTFQNNFDEGRFRFFAKNLFNDLDESKAFSYHGQYLPDAYREHICQYKRLGKYTDPDGVELDILIVTLKKETALDRARTRQRNFIAWYLKNRCEKDAAIVTPLNEERPAVWEQVSDWIDRNGSISNQELCRIAGIETLKASKMLKIWVDADMLVPDTTKGKRGTKYMRVGSGFLQQSIFSLSELADNEIADDE